MRFPDIFRRKKKKAVDSVPALTKKNKVALCLGGGGARGFAHIGALKAFEENGIEFDLCAGTSAGSLVGAFYCAGISPDQLAAYSHEINLKDVKPNSMFIPSDPLNIGEIFTRRMGNMYIEDMLRPFYCVSVDLVSGKQIIFDKGPVKEAVSASCCVPLIFKPLVIGDMHLIDGGVLNNIPASVCRMFGADKVVTVDVNPTRGGGTNELGTIDVLKGMFSIMSANTSVDGLRLSDVVISLDTAEYSSAKKDGYEEMMLRGYETTMQKIEEIKALFI